MSMQDRELLELAAKAAAIDLSDTVYNEASGSFIFRAPHQPNWNPIADDGDALRLAVKLNLQVTFDSLSQGPAAAASIPWDNEWFDTEHQWFEWLNDDPYAATRRAIVRAAAAIGEQMK